ncbi:MAG: hypothetical protein IJE89_00825 [Bacilli bacterium]|nr:hypothetical protein [Bacilli bacterium]
MKNIKSYNLYMFVSTLTRNIIDIYSVVLLYQNRFSVNNIIGIYAITYFIGSYISTLSIKIGNSIGFKYILIFSSIITSISFYIINKSNDPYIISLFLSLSIFTYHPIKHYYGINLLNKKDEIGNTIILTYIATILSSYFAIKEVKVIYLVIISLLSIIPSLFIKKEQKQKITYPKSIPKKTLNFFILDQTKILFLLLQPLYLYTISNTLSYVGIFNIIITISSIMYIYFFANKKDVEKYYKYINIAFVVILLLKLNIDNKIILLIIAFLEGIGIKTNELISTMNLYKNKKYPQGYIIVSEIIFCLVRGLFLSIIYIFKINLKSSLYLLLIGIFLLSFQYNKTCKK